MQCAHNNPEEVMIVADGRESHTCMRQEFQLKVNICILYKCITSVRLLNQLNHIIYQVTCSYFKRVLHIEIDHPSVVFMSSRRRVPTIAGMPGRRNKSSDHPAHIISHIGSGQSSCNGGRSPPCITSRSRPARSKLSSEYGFSRARISHNKIENEYTSAERW